MAVPKYYELFNSFLSVLADGETHTAKDVREKIARDIRLSAEDAQALIPSGRQTVFAGRVGWARWYLNKAGLIKTPAEGKYQITEEGRRALASGRAIDLSSLGRAGSSGKAAQTTPAPGGEPDGEPPLEELEAAFQRANAALASDLLDEVVRLTPTEFEKLVVKLLLKMGYGNGVDEAGLVTRQSNDEGIDGIIKEDQLGFSQIYIQAKKWDVKQTVGKPEIQKFVGALQGRQAQKGLFITTAKYSSGALQYAENLLGAKVVLVDGSVLTRLMIRHNVGVSVEHVYEIKRIDSDFFADEL